MLQSFPIKIVIDYKLLNMAYKALYDTAHASLRPIISTALPLCPFAYYTSATGLESTKFLTS